MPTATAERRRDWLVRIGGPVVALAGATTFVVVAGRRSTPEAEAPTPVAVEASGTPVFTDLTGLIRASDLVVTGRVELTARGRLVGDPTTGGIVSRFVTLEVDDVLWAPSGDQPEHVVIEEEGWLVDGTPIEVNGMAASEEGQEGLWFLDLVETTEGGTFVVVNEQGRYLDEDGRSVGADRPDALIDRMEALPFADAVARVREVVAA